MTEVAAGSVEEKAEELQEELGDGQAFGTFPQATERFVQERQDLDVGQIAYKQSQTAPAGNNVIGDANVIDTIGW